MFKRDLAPAWCARQRDGHASAGAAASLANGAGKGNAGEQGRELSCAGGWAETGKQTHWLGKGRLVGSRVRRELCSPKARAGEVEAADPAPGHPRKCNYD